MDLADSQITQGHEIIQSMGLTNVRLLEYFIYQVGSFTIQSLTQHIEENKEFANITENELYSAVLSLVILGYVYVYLTTYPIYSFEDNKTYIPKRFTQYVTTLVEGANQYIGAGNLYTGAAEDLNNLPLYIMSQMEKPTTKAELKSALQGYLIQNEYQDMNNNDKLIDEIYDCTELFNALCDVLTRLGYIQPVNL